MRKWIVAGAVLIAAIGAALALLFNLNSLIARNKDYLLAQAEQALGRKISVGEVEATLFTGLGLRLENFTMSDDPAYSSREFVRAKDLQINVKFWPLLRKEVQVKRAILHSPSIQVIRNADGKFNFATIGKKEKEKSPAEKAKLERDPKEAAAETAPGFAVSLVDISDGDIRYLDQKDGADLRIRRIDLKIEDLDASQPISVRLDAAVYSDKQNFRFAGNLGPVRPGGDFSQTPLEGEIDIAALDLARLGAALPQLKKILPKDLDLSGAFSVKDLKLKGTLKDLALNGQIDGTQGALRQEKTFQKPAGVPLVLQVEARYAGDKVTIRSSRLKLHTLDLAASGDVRLGAAPELDLSAKAAPASLDGWDKILPALASYQLKGTMEFQATVRGRVGNGAAPQVQGVLTLQNASAKPPDFPKPIENLDTKINFTGQRATIRDMSLSLGKSRLRLAAAVEKFSPLTLSYRLSTPEIFPADYRTGLAAERQADVIRNLQSEGQLSLAGGRLTYQGKLSSADGTLYAVAYKNLDAALSVAEKVARIGSLRVNALSGTVQAEGEYAFKEATPRFSLASKMQGVDVKELYAALDAKAERDVRGRLNADMKLAGSGKTWEEIKPTLRGQGEAEVLQGALLNFNIAEGAIGGITGMPGLANMINPNLRKKYPDVFAAKDTEFKELKATFDMAEGRINIKNLRMAAAEFLAQGEGWADFNRRVDFRSTVYFSQRLSADLAQSAREVKYLLNNQGQLEIPLTLSGRLPHVKPKPDTRFLAQMVQRGFLRKGTEELQNRFFGAEKDSGAQSEEPSEGAKKSRKRSTEELIRKGLENLFRR